MEQDNVIKATIQFDYGSAPRAQAVVSDTYKKMNADAKEANARAQQYSEQYAAFWINAMDKIDAREAKAAAERHRQYAKQNAAARDSSNAYAAEQRRKEKADSDYVKTWEKLLSQRDAREAKSRKASVDAERKAAKEVQDIIKQTHKQAQEQAEFREKMAARMASAQKKQNEQAARNNSNSLITQIQSMRSGSTGGGGGPGGGGMLGMIFGGGEAGGALATVAAVTAAVTAAVAVVAALGAAAYKTGEFFFNLTKTAADYGEQIYKAHQKTRFSTESLSVMKLAADETHTSFDQIVRAAARYEVNLSKAFTNPTLESARALKTMGFEGKKLAEAMKNPEAAFFEITKKMDAMEDVTKRDRIALSLFGRDFQSLIPVLEELGSKYDENRKRAEEFGLVMNVQQAKSLRDFNVKLRDLGAVFSGIGLRIGAVLAPKFIELFDIIIRGLAKLGPLWTWIGALVYVTLEQQVLHPLASTIAAIQTIPTAAREMATVVTSAFADVQKSIAGASTTALGLVFALSGNMASGTALIAAGLKSIREAGADALSHAQQSGRKIVDEYNKNYAEIRKPLDVHAPQDGEGGDDSGPFTANNRKARKQLSEYEKLVKRYKELTADILSFLDVKSKEFSLRFKVEDLEQFKRDLEAVVKLRRELGLQLDAPLPRNGEATKALLEDLQSFKRVQDSVKRSQNEAQGAAEQLAEAILTKSLPVIDAETRAHIAYDKAVRDRRNSEQQLTADLVVLTKQRADALKDEVGETLRAYTELRLDATKQAEEARRSALKEQIRLLTNLGQEPEFRAKLEAELKLIQPERDRQVTAVEAINSNVEKILAALTKGQVTNPNGSDRTFTAGEGTGSTGHFSKSLRDAVSLIRENGGIVAHTTDGKHNRGSLHALGLAADVVLPRMDNASVSAFFERMEALGFETRDERRRPKGQKVWNKPHLHLSWANGVGMPSAMPSPWLQSGSVNVPSPFSGNLFGEDGGPPITSFSKTLGVTLAEMNADTPRGEALRSKAKELNDLFDTQRRLAEEEQVEAKSRAEGLTDILSQLRLENAITEQRIRRREDAEAEQVATALLRKDLEDLRNGDPEARQRVVRSAEQKRLSEQIDTSKRVIELQEELAHASEGAADRYTVAWLEALREVQKADEDAVTSQIRSQVRLADQTVFHSERAKAAILDHMASEKGYTEIFSDAFIKTSDLIGDGMTSLFQKVNSGLGKFGDIITDIEASLLKMVTNRLLMKLVDAILGGGSSTGRGGVFGEVFGGGSQGGGVFSFGGNLLSRIVGAPAGNGASGPWVDPVAFTREFGEAPGVSTLSGQAAQRSFLQTLLGGAGGSPVSTIFGASNTLAGSLALTGATMAPMVGMSLGGMLGGQSGFGRGLGMAGGLLLGSAGAVGLLGGSGAAIFGAGGALGSLGGAAALLTNPFTIAAGVALLAGAFIVGRNKQRRADETTRNGAILDAFAQMDELIRKVRNHQTDPQSALESAAQIRQKYVDDMSQLKDKKTRSHALADVSRIDAKIGQLRAAATGALNDNRRANLTAAFATGGVVPGQRGEPRLVLAHGGEIISGLANQTPAFVAAAAEAGIPGVRGTDTGGSGRNVNLSVELHVGTETRDKLVVDGMKSDKGYKTHVENNRQQRRYGDT